MVGGVENSRSPFNLLAMVVEAPWSSHAPPTGLSLPLQPYPCTPTNPRRRSPWPGPYEALDATLTPPLHSSRHGETIAYPNRTLAPSRVLAGDLTAGGSPVGEEKGIFTTPTTSRAAPPSSTDHDHADHIPSSSAEQL